MSGVFARSLTRSSPRPSEGASLLCVFASLPWFDYREGGVPVVTLCGHCSCVRRENCRKPPAPDQLYTDIYYNEVPSFIRGVEIETSLINGKVAH